MGGFIILVFIAFILFLILGYDLFYNIKCPKCGHNMLGHSHTENINGVDIEVYKCNNCKNKYV